jgi:hypothetical protein
MGDLELAPELIRALLDPDEGVSAEARVSLEVMSRKLEGYGPPRGAAPEQRLAAAKRWRDWFDNVRPPGLEALDDASLLSGLGKLGGSSAPPGSEPAEGQAGGLP